MADAFKQLQARDVKNDIGRVRLEGLAQPPVLMKAACGDEAGKGPPYVGHAVVGLA